ncbi:hypothetical protein Q7P37_010326 [Cladosporium fusiforme]
MQPDTPPPHQQLIDMPLINRLYHREEYLTYLSNTNAGMSNNYHLQQQPKVYSSSQQPHIHASSCNPCQEGPVSTRIYGSTTPRISQAAPEIEDEIAELNKSSNTSRHSHNDEAKRNHDVVPSAQIPSSIIRHERQRTKHNASDRRYRESLNAHLERLRQTVPRLATHRSPDGVSLHTSETHTVSIITPSSNGTKPSKCEILNGAIAYIGAVEKENSTLCDEIEDLRKRVEHLERLVNDMLKTAGRGGMDMFTC